MLSSHHRGKRVASILTIALVILFVAIGCAASYRQRSASFLESSAPSSDAEQKSPPSSSSPNAIGAPNSTIQPDDLVAVAQDYRIGPNDLLSVSISDLAGPKLETVKNMRVSEATGSVRLALDWRREGNGPNRTRIGEGDFGRVSQRYFDRQVRGRCNCAGISLALVFDPRRPSVSRASIKSSIQISGFSTRWSTRMAPRRAHDSASFEKRR